MCINRITQLPFVMYYDHMNQGMHMNKEKGKNWAKEIKIIKFGVWSPSTKSITLFIATSKVSHIWVVSFHPFDTFSVMALCSFHIFFFLLRIQEVK